MSGIGVREDGPDAHEPRLSRGKPCSARPFLPSPISFAIIREGQHTPPLLPNSALRRRPSEFIILTPRPCHAFRFGHTLDPVLLRSFRPIARTCQLTTAPMCRLSPLAPSSPSMTRRRSPSTPQAPSETRLRSTTPLLPPTPPFIVGPPPPRLLVVSRSYTLAFLRRSSFETS